METIQVKKPVQTLDQQRADYAWRECSSAVAKCGDAYVNLAKGAGALIMSNGLMAALAYYEDKAKNKNGEYPEDKKHYKDLQLHTMIWLVKRELIMGKSFVDFMNALHQLDSRQYRAVTQEVLDLLRWIRQFAAAVNTKEAKNG